MLAYLHHRGRPLFDRRGVSVGGEQLGQPLRPLLRIGEPSQVRLVPLLELGRTPLGELLEGAGLHLPQEAHGTDGQVVIRLLEAGTPALGQGVDSGRPPPAWTPCRSESGTVPCQHVAGLLEGVEMFANAGSRDVQSLRQFGRGRGAVDEQAARHALASTGRLAFHNSIVA